MNYQNNGNYCCVPIYSTTNTVTQVKFGQPFFFAAGTQVIVENGYQCLLYEVEQFIDTNNDTQ